MNSLLVINAPIVFLHCSQSHTCQRPVTVTQTHLPRKNEENEETGRAGFRKWFNVSKYLFMFCMWEYSIFSWLGIYFQYKYDKPSNYWTPLTCSNFIYIFYFVSVTARKVSYYIPQRNRGPSQWLSVNQTWIGLISKVQVLSSRFCCSQESKAPTIVSFDISTTFLLS